MAKQRQQLLAPVYGEVLEIGFGTGLNLPHYPGQVRKITTVDPNAGMHQLAQQRLRRSQIEVDHRLLSGDGSLSRATASIVPSAPLPCVALKKRGRP